MDTQVAYEKEGKKFNQFHHQIIDCTRECGRKTTATGTGLCDFCWESDREVYRKQIEDRANIPHNPRSTGGALFAQSDACGR